MDQSKHNRQLALELKAVGLGADRYDASWTDRSATKAGKQLMLQESDDGSASNIQVVALAIEEWCEKAHTKAGAQHSAVQYLDLVDPFQAAYLSLRIIIKMMGGETKVQACALGIASAIQDHLNFTHFAAKNGGLYRKIVRQLKHSTSGKHRSGVWGAAMRVAKMAKLEWAPSDRTILGMKLIELVAESTGFIEIIRQNVPGRRHDTPLMMRPTKRCVEWIEEAHHMTAEFQPAHLPMVVPPVAWQNPYRGGYLTSVGQIKLVKTSNKAYLDELGSIHMPLVYAAVNQVQATAWKINRAVFDVLTGVQERGETLGGLPPAEKHPPPPRHPGLPANVPTVDMTEEQQVWHKEWKAAASKVHEANARLVSKRVALKMMINVAKQFVDDDAIYFPHQLDFRGRMYPMPTFLHPQAEDSAKGLLMFAEGKALGSSGAFWLAVHIANLFGVDKVSFDERVQWVYANEAAILDSAFDPLDGKRFWDTAEKPYQALAACYEWAGYKVQGEEFVSHLPIALDGSCSGLQHFSAMLRDEIGGAAVNLVPTDKPSDIYSTIAAKTQFSIDASANEESVIWKGGKVIRRIVKQPSMTLTYGATRYGMQEQIEGVLRKLDSDNGKPHLGVKDQNYQASKFLSHVVFETIGTVVVAARSAMDWLCEAAMIATYGAIPVTWTSPCGFPVQQEYKEELGQRVDVFYQGRRVRVTVVRDGERLDKSKQASSISPNFVHSLDAAHLMRTVALCGDNGIDDVCVIHDSFATHAANTDELATLLRTAFIEQYTPDVLARFRDQLAAQLQPALAMKLPPLPLMGTLDLARVAESDFFFA